MEGREYCKLTIMKHFDAIIIGSGQGGTPLAKKLAKAGHRVALIEKRWIGGTCVNDGCTPTKAMIACAKMAHDARQSDRLGIQTGAVSVDLAAIVARKNDIVKKFREGAKEGLQQTKNLELMFGEARFTDVKQMMVTLNSGQQQELSADLVFINTGTSPGIAPVEGIDNVSYLTSTTILDLEHIPEHLLIAGGGYVGMEFGQMFSRFGSKVTILEQGDHLLPREDRDIADCISGIMKEEGITFHTKATLKKVSGKERITATIEVDGNKQRIDCTHLLMATGRTPQTDQLNLDLTGVKINSKGYIEVNDRLETSQPGIYALGDVKGGPAFTHISYNDHLVVYKNLVEQANQSIKNRLVTYCMFTDPQLGRVGLSEQQARNKGMDIQVATISMKHVARAIETGQDKGIMKAVVDRKSKLILGAAIIGEEGGETMSVLQVAMMGGITYEQLRDNPFAHPLYAESINNLFFSLED